ncbi:uncharacterized protein LOC117780278 [Drosophila innubila]|uniref:uncharacterized protein LOC117780278 n=1 Tax=Drosophila innubila TaxID=198719 RepID=UPI00148D5E91|nr:uncharacterized protein LOC117780278 [Drosophila innubila]
MNYSYTVICLLLIAACLVVPGAARGGRGRGGGSFGGLFGGWRSKYGSKSSSSGSGRRVMSGSPVHTAMTVPKVPPPPPPPAKPMSMPKPQVGNYPRQQLPPGYSYAPGTGQGTYYANSQALPTGAIYYPQSPMGMSMGSGTSGFLTGMLAGRLMDGMLYGRHHHVSHVYHQNQQGESATSDSGRQIIIINNGQHQAEGEGRMADSDSDSDSKQVMPENPQTQVEEGQERNSSEEATSDSTAPAAPPAGGIVCFPIMLNETDPQNSEVVREVERVVCFPAPPSIDPQLANVDCQNDPQCILDLGSSTTSTEPPVVAGDIGGATEGEADDNKEGDEEGDEEGEGDGDGDGDGEEEVELEEDEASSTISHMDTTQN